MKRQLNDLNGTPSGTLPSDDVIQGIKQQCQDIANSDDTQFMDVNALQDINDSRWNTTLPKCPPIGIQVDLSPEFERFNFQGDDCHRSKNTFIPLVEGYIFVSVCCYDMNINSR